MGDEDAGGDCSEMQNQLKADVQAIFCSDKAFAALKADGSIVTWAQGKDTEVAVNKARQALDQELPSTPQDCPQDHPIAP